MPEGTNQFLFTAFLSRNVWEDAYKEVTSRRPKSYRNLFIEKITTVKIDETAYILSTNSSKGVTALKNLERFYQRVFIWRKD